MKRERGKPPSKHQHKQFKRSKIEKDEIQGLEDVLRQQAPAPGTA